MSMTYADNFYSNNSDKIFDECYADGDHSFNGFDEKMDKLKDEELNKLKQENEKLKECVKYIRASHKCICDNELKVIGLVCSLCMADKTLKELSNE